MKGIHRVTKTLSGGRKVEYHYACRGGPKFWQSDTGIPKHGPLYWKAYTEALSSLSTSKGYFREVLQDYLQSPEFTRLKERSQKDIRTSIFHPVNGIDQKFGDAPIDAFNRDDIRKIIYRWRDGIAGDRVADMRITHLSGILSWALDRRYIKAHHARAIKRRYKSDRSHIIWTNDEIAAFVAGAPSWLGNILVTATETGLRPGDLIRLNRSHVDRKAKTIRLRTGKRDRMVAIPLTARMEALINTLPRDQLLICPSASLRPISDPMYPGKKVGQWRDKLDLRPELHLYDARGTAATRLFEADASLRQISMAMGWSLQHTAAMIQVYAALNPDAPTDLLDRLNRS